MRTNCIYSLLLILFLILLANCKKENNDIAPPTVNPVVNAGSDIQNYDGFCVTLSADSLTKGESGEWSIEKGLVDEKVYFENKNSPKSKFYGLPGEKYILQWKVLLNGKYYIDSVYVSFNPITVVISKIKKDFYSTRIGLEANGTFKGTWTITGDIQKYESTQLGGIIVPKENFPSIKVYGKENGTIYAKYTIKYGSVSFSDTVIVKTGTYNEYEALEDIGILDNTYHYDMENGHVVTIELGGDGHGWIFQDLDRFPSLISLKYLKRLVLYGDGIVTFPSVITSYYKDLIYLDLSFNYIKQIPSNIGNLKKLETLNLLSQQDINNPSDDHAIKQLPETFGDLESLKSFTLSSILLDLPISFGNLHNLETLDFESTSLNSIPSSFGNLSSLKSFRTLGFRGDLPETFCQLTNLTEFVVSDCALTKLPDNFGNLKNLKILWLHGNNTFETLPDGFSGLDSLQELNLVCKLKVLPDNFGNLKNIRQINLYADLKELPPSFCNLKTLEIFDLECTKNSDLFILPENIGDLSNLKGLAIVGRNLHSIPNSICQLPKLTGIIFKNCSLDSVPSCIGNLRNLFSIDFTSNNLISIPITFKNLKGGALSRMNLTGNPGLAWQIDEIKSWGICYYLYYW